MPEPTGKVARKAWETRKRKKKHDSYLERIKWIRQRAVFLKPFLISCKEESARHDNCCAVCGESMPNTLHVHHLNGNHMDNNDENKITLCASCHSIIHKAKSHEDALHDFKERHKRTPKTKTQY